MQRNLGMPNLRYNRSVSKLKTLYPRLKIPKQYWKWQIDPIVLLDKMIVPDPMQNLQNDAEPITEDTNCDSDEESLLVPATYVPEGFIRETYMCHKCITVFDSESNLDYHHELYHRNSVACELCSKRFTNVTDLASHTEEHRILEPHLFRSINKTPFEVVLGKLNNECNI